jgi:predicted RND superfamily exporter protein
MSSQGVYERLARTVLAHRARVLWAALVVGVVSAVIGLPPEMDSDLINMLPTDEPAVAAIRRLADDGVGINFLTLSFGGEDPEALDAWLDDFVVRLEAMDEIELAVHEVDPEVARQVGLLQFEASELEELNVRLQGALALGPALNPLVSAQLMDMGPLTERIAGTRSDTLLRSEPGVERVLIHPVESPGNAEFVIPFMESIEAQIEAADPAAAGVKLLWSGGAYRHTYEDLKGIESDLVATSVGSLVLVLGTIVVAFGSLRAVMLVFPPLLLANVINLALVRLFMGPLNTYTSLGTAILVGLGIDFAVHLIGRFREQRRQGDTVDDAIAVAWQRTGPPCAIAAVTSAGGFLALAAAEFKGFAQLGTVLAMGLIICLVCMFVLLPVLLARFDSAPPAKAMPTVAAKASSSTYRWAPVGLATMLALTAAVGMWSVPRLDFEYDLSALRRDGLAYAELTDLERGLARDAYSPVVVTFPDRASLVSAQRRVLDAIVAGEVQHIGGVVSVHNVLPEDQAARNDQIRQLVAHAEHPNLRYLPRPIATGLVDLRGLVVRELGSDDVPAPVRDLLGVDDPSEDRMLLLPKGNMWDVREASALAEEIETLLPGREAAGEYLGISAMFLITFRDVPKISGVALLLVVLCTALDLRAVGAVVAVVGSLLAGLAWSAGGLVLTDTRITMVNLTGLPILLGIGVDVVIHLAHRLREEGRGGVRRALRTTGVSAGVSAITTIFSFFSLTFAGHRGVRSLGMLVVVGLALVVVVSAVLLPLAWMTGWRLSEDDAEST